MSAYCGMIHLAVITLDFKYLCEMPDVCYNAWG